MTKETLNKANIISKKIEEYKSFLRAFDSPYGNAIRANNFIGEVEDNKYLHLKDEPELEMKIREYIMHQISVLEKAFAKLN